MNTPKTHECKEPTSCACDSSAFEPNDECPVHAGGPWPPRCGECGRFMKREIVNEIEQ